MTTLGSWLKGEGFTVDDNNVPYGRDSTWYGVDFLLIHHTASDDDGSESSIASYIRTGGSGTYPPLAQIMLGQSGKVWMCSKERSGQPDPGRASHAGSGSGYGVPVDSMNSYSLGIECQCDGSHPLATHSTLYRTLIELCAALCRRYHLSADKVIGHKEWSSTGKIDPRDDMDKIRSDIAAELGSSSGAPYVTEHVYRSKCGYGEPTNGDDFSDTVKELQERLNRIHLEGGQDLPVTGRYDAETDEKVRLWQEQICGDPPDPVNQSFLGPKQFAYMFPDSIYTLHDDGNPAIADGEVPPDAPEPPVADSIVSEQYGTWEWYSGKDTDEWVVYPSEDWIDIPGFAQPVSNIKSGDPHEEHSLYMRVKLPAGRSAERILQCRFMRSNGDETANDYRPMGLTMDSYPFRTIHTENGSGLGGKWQIWLTGGTDPVKITTRYAKTFIRYHV